MFLNKNYVGGRNFWLHCKDKKSLVFQAKEKASKAKNCFPEDKNFQINIFWMETQKYCHQPCLSNSDKELRMFAEQRQKEMRKQARPKLFTQGQNLSRFAFSADWYHCCIMLNFHTYQIFKPNWTLKKIDIIMVFAFEFEQIHIIVAGLCISSSYFPSRCFIKWFRIEGDGAKRRWFGDSNPKRILKLDCLEFELKFKFLFE